MTIKEEIQKCADDPDVQKFMKKSVRDAYAVTLAENGEKLKEMCEKFAKVRDAGFPPDSEPQCQVWSAPVAFFGPKVPVARELPWAP